MCKVKSGVLITNKEDVQNMIIGIIFRQQTKYRREHILESAKKYFKGSALEINNNALGLIVDENLDILSRNGAICCKNGNYIPEKFI